MHFIRPNNESAMGVALLILALIPLSQAMPLLVEDPGKVLLGTYKGIFESDSPPMIRSGRVLATGDQASGIHTFEFIKWLAITTNLDLCRLFKDIQLPPTPRSF